MSYARDPMKYPKETTSCEEELTELTEAVGEEGRASIAGGKPVSVEWRKRANAVRRGGEDQIGASWAMLETP